MCLNTLPNGNGITNVFKFSSAESGLVCSAPSRIKYFMGESADRIYSVLMTSHIGLDRSSNTPLGWCSHVYNGDVNNAFLRGILRIINHT